MNRNYTSQRISIRRPKRFRRSSRYNAISRIAKRTMLNTSETKIALFIIPNTNYVGANLFTVFPLDFSIDLGPGKSQRIGNKIKYKNLNVKLAITGSRNNASTLNYITSNGSFRVAILQMRQLISDASQVFLYSAAPYAANGTLNRFNPNTVRVMRDELGTISYGGPIANPQNDAATPSRFTFNWNFKVHNEVNLKDNQAADPLDRYILFIAHENDTAGGNEEAFTRIKFESIASISYVDI